ncbi:hypothetical protein ACHAXR_006319, partial [Thalassiosira sp. AJA248-18]
MGYEASSPVEGSFSAFQRALGNVPRSFVGVVQEHVKKDIQKNTEERRRVINLQIRAQDVELIAQRRDAANDNSGSFVVKRRNILNVEEAPSPRVVEEIGGIKYCSRLEDRNWGYPCRHIHCVLGGAFREVQFNKHFEIAVGVPEDDAVRPLSLTASDEDNVGNVNESIMDDGVGEFVSEYASLSESSQFVSEVRRPVFRVKRMDGTANYNHIIAEAKEIASIASSERNSCFEKVRNFMKWLRNNIQQNI